MRRGAYGVVCSVSIPDHEEVEEEEEDAKEGETYAIKKCKHIFDSLILAKRTLREIRYLRHLEHPNVCLYGTCAYVVLYSPAV